MISLSLSVRWWTPFVHPDPNALVRSQRWVVGKHHQREVRQFSLVVFLNVGSLFVREGKVPGGREDRVNRRRPAEQRERGRASVID